MDEASKPAPTDTGKPPEGTKTDAPDELLKKLSGVLGREFKDADDLLKSVDNLHRMVGDQAVAELRTKAAQADDFSKVIAAYAKEEGVTIEQARKEILSSVEETQTKPMENENKTTLPDDVMKRLEKAEAIAEKVQVRELLEAHPESKHVIEEIKSLARAAGKDMKEFYESSALKEVATKVAAHEKAESEKSKESTSPDSNSRQSPNLAEHSELVKAVSSGNASENQRVDLVKKALGM